MAWAYGPARGREEQIELARPADPESFQPRAPWWGGDLQTLRNAVRPSRAPEPAHSERLLLGLRDGSGDRLSGLLQSGEQPDAGPLIILIHGLAGSEHSAYMRASAAFHLARGRRVLRLNLRGAGPSRASCAGHYHAGCARDIHDALAALPEPLSASGLFPIGYSLGGNALINLLAAHDLPIVGAASVSAPIEPAQAATRFMEPRNAIYHYWLLRQTKKETIAPGAHLTPKERERVERSRTIYEFDDWFIAPRNGFAGADDYYERTAGARVAGRIEVPTLMVHAKDDPWIPPGPYVELARHAPSNVEIALTDTGGHVGFHSHDHEETWHDRRVDSFLRSL